MREVARPVIGAHDRSRIALALVLVAVVALSVLAATSAAQAAASPPSVPLRQSTPVKHWRDGMMTGAFWMIKANDYAEFPKDYGRWEWVTCGKSVIYGGDAPWASATDPTYPNSYGPCERGQVPTFARYRALERWLAGGRHRGMTVLFDQENWPWTPAREYAAQDRYIRLACTSAKKAGVQVIATSSDTFSNLKKEWATAARYCPIVAAQSQGWILGGTYITNADGRSRN